MIQNSFVFLDGVGSRLEKTLWDGGIRTWDSFLDKENIKGISRHRKLYYNRKIMEARRALYSYDLQYFLHNLPKAEMWRLYEFFKDEAVFIDIETDGLSGRSDITVFGLYDGINSKTMIRGVNLNYNALKEELKKYKLFVTFNGAAFDIPFIEKRYPGLLPKIPNFDVKCLSSRLGFKGGLKAIEKQMGITRTDLVQRFSGGDALTLWRMYRATGDSHYLNLLVEYNEFDIINLKTVADKCIKLFKEKFTQS